MFAGHSVLCPYEEKTWSTVGRDGAHWRSKRGSSTACPGASRKTKGAGHSAQNDGAEAKAKDNSPPRWQRYKSCEADRSHAPALSYAPYDWFNDETNAGLKPEFWVALFVG